jgi:hypothetical protein
MRREDFSFSSSDELEIAYYRWRAPGRATGIVQIAHGMGEHALRYELAIKMGLQVVNDTLANNYIRPDESAKAQSKVKENGKYSFIDKVKVRLVDSDYWAEAVNFNNKFLHVFNQYVRDYERLLMGGVWAQLDMRFEYDEEAKGKNPFWIDKLTPIQIATFDLDERSAVPGRSSPARPGAGGSGDGRRLRRRTGGPACRTRVGRSAASTPSSDVRAESAVCRS